MRWTYEKWRSYSDEHWKTRDIAFANMCSAIGLPGVDEKAIPAHQEKLNQWASAVRLETERLIPRFEHNPAQYQSSQGKFRMLVLVTVLQRDLGVRYNQEFMQGDFDGTDPRNLFLHGLLTGFGGTCVTMPLLYIAIGRRLRYPLHLVETKSHYFVRWEGDDERFNIEATSLGFNSHTDEYYHDWPKRLSTEELRKGTFLRNLTPREEVASYWLSRGTCFFEHLILHEAVMAFHHAREMAPKLPTAQGSLFMAVAAREILQNMQSKPSRGSLVQQIEKACPKISEPWHPLAIQHAKQELLRIDRVRQKKASQKISRRRGASYVVQPMRIVTRPKPLFWDDAIGGVCPCSAGLQKPPCTWAECTHRQKLPANESKT